MYALSRPANETRAKAERANLVAIKTLSKDRRKEVSLDNWELSDFVHVAHALDIITKPTFQLADAARDFRNLIHPGKAIRERQRCAQGTAFAAAGAMEQVIEDLSR